MGDTDTAATIRAALAAHVKQDIESIRSDLTLREDLGLDSMSVIELLYKLEESFDVQIPDQDLGQLRTVGDVMDYVQRIVPSPVSRKQANPSRSRRPSSSRKNPRR